MTDFKDVADLLLEEKKKNPKAFVNYKVVEFKPEKQPGFELSGDAPCYVVSVVPGSAAERSGIRVGSSLLRVNGVDVSTRASSACNDIIKKAKPSKKKPVNFTFGARNEKYLRSAGLDWTIVRPGGLKAS